MQPNGARPSQHTVMATGPPPPQYVTPPQYQQQYAQQQTYPQQQYTGYAQQPYGYAGGQPQQPFYGQR